MTLSEFFASQQTWYETTRCAELLGRTRRAIDDYSAWAASDPDVTSVTLDSINAYEAVDDSRKRRRFAQALRTVRRRYLAIRKAGEAIVVPDPIEPPPVLVMALEPAPDPGSQPSMSLNYLAQLYVASNPRLRSKHSKTLMLQAFARFQEYLAREGTLSDLSDQSLVAFAAYRKTLGRAERTIERELSKLSTLWRYGAMRGWCAPVHFSVQKCAKPTPTAWNPEEMEMIFKAASDYRSTLGGLPANLVLMAALRLAYDTGERRNAIFAVLWSDIDLNRRFVTYRGETRKGGARAADNLQRFSRKTRDALTALRKQVTLLGKESGRVFPEVHVTSLYGHLKLILKSIGLDSGRNCMFHKIRRTHATHLYLAGGDPTQSLGHESDAMTRGYYLDPKQTRNGFFADLIGIRGIFARFGRTMKRAFGII